MTSTLVSKSAGCHKCGQRGHWARDCTNAPSAGIQLDETEERHPEELANDGQEMSAPQEGNEQSATQRKRVPRQKLSLALLQETKGIPDLENNFYTAMKSVFRGKGHEISDTRRLLELYKRWNDRVLPHSGPNDTFDSFIAAAEKLSSTSEVKHMMNNKRMEVLESAVEASKLDLEEPEEAHSSGEVQNEEEELLQLAMTGDDGTGLDRNGSDDELELENNDEEMLGLIDDGNNGEPAELQDDELLDLLFEN